MDAVEVSGLRVVRRGVEVLHGLDATVPAGQVVGLLGPSGSGKSTLLRAVVGVQARVSGTVTVLGLPAGTPALRSRVGYMTQSPAVYLDLTVVQNLRYAASLLRVGAAEVEQVVRAVDLQAESAVRVDRLSGGQQARVSLALALLGDPELVVLDEPTVGLDPVLREQLWGLFRSLAAAGTTLLVSSHVMEEAARCDRLLLLRDGRLLADDTPAGLLARTGAPDVDAAFLRLVRDGAHDDRAHDDGTRHDGVLP